MIENANELMKKIKNGIIVETDYIRVYNSTFLVLKPDGKIRKILDCRQVNKITNFVKFKMEGAQFIKKILAQHDYALTLDLENAFNYMKVSDSFHLYFGFSFLGKTFAYSGHSFGYKNIIYIFIKTLRIALKEIRKIWKVKVLIIYYIYDINLIIGDKDELTRIIIRVIQFLKDLGWKFLTRQCRIHPLTAFIYLGWEWNSQMMEVKMAHATRRFLKNLLKRWILATLNQQIVKVKDLASLISSLNYLLFQFPDTSLYLNSLNHLKCYALNKRGWDCSVKLSKKIIGNLFKQLKTIKNNRLRSLNQAVGHIAMETVRINGCRIVEQELALEKQQLTRDGSSSYGTSSLSTIISEPESQFNYSGDRQSNSRILIKTLERKTSDDSFGQADISTTSRDENHSVYETHSGLTESESRLSQQTCMEGGLHDKYRDLQCSNNVSQLLPRDRSLSHTNNEFTQMMLLDVAGQKHRGKKEGVQHILGEPPVINPSYNLKDPSGSEQTTKETFDSPVRLTGLAHEQVQPIVSQDTLSIESELMPNGT
ncbi:MAG: hypothetical protein EZS28_002513 [Streblomastix strix]|uniref:Reverse transcriptase domain-containing protein n=1 Tax=Streblomastix strix TaxID=222440 RepID=A0A5J4X418_9EUKA|nr:MAG: hypothetical protein EZS28_002513 [Streblomastix strix]